jgi:hypothetical protein
MSDIARHTTWAASINGSVLSSIIDNSLSINPALQKAMLAAGGSILPTLAATLTNTPKISFKTHDLNLVSAPTKITSVVLVFRAYDEATGIGTGYISFTASKGLVVPMTMQGAQGQAAELSVDIHPVSSDGVTDPITIGTTSSLMGVHGDAYVLGDLTIGSAIAGIQDINLNFGYNIATNAGENGKTYPTLAYIDKQEAGLTVKTTAMSAATQARLNTGVNTADVSFSFKKLVEGGVPSGSLTGTIKKALVQAEGITGGRPATCSLLVTPVHAGLTDDYLTWASA